MKKRVLLYAIATLLIAGMGLSYLFVQDSMKKPKVLMIGDSVSIGYSKYVAAYLIDDADVFHTPNAHHTREVLGKLDEWLGNTKWDVIHFNAGLWDICYRTPEEESIGEKDKFNGTLSVPLDDYKNNLKAIVSRLDQSGAKLIWAETTFVPENEPGRFTGDEVKYNAAAEEIMKTHGVTIDPLWQTTNGFPPELFSAPGNVHYTEDGYQLLATYVALSIKKVLSETKSD